MVRPARAEEREVSLPIAFSMQGFEDWAVIWLPIIFMGLIAVVLVYMLRFMPRIDLSSSLVRQRAASGRPIRYLLPDKVADYVEAEGLYGMSRAVRPE